METPKLCTRCAFLSTFFFIASFGSRLEFSLCCGYTSQVFQNIPNTSLELQYNASTEMQIHSRNEQFVIKIVTLNPGDIGITFNSHGLITDMEEDAQPSILDTLKMPGWKIIRINKKMFSSTLFMAKRNGSRQYNITVKRKQKTFHCDICFEDYSEFEFYKYMNPRCGHTSCLKCFLQNWNIGANGQRCWACRGYVMHALLVAVNSYNVQYVKSVIKEGRNYGFSSDLVREAISITRDNQFENITELLRPLLYESKIRIVWHLFIPDDSFEF